MAEENSNDNVIGLYEIVRDRYGKKHKVYSAKFKDLHTIMNFTQHYSPDSFGLYMLAPVIDKDGEVDMDAEGNINYDNGFYDDLMEMIEMALDHRETREQIEEWLDVEVARNIIMVYLRVSQFKKKQSIKSGEETHWRNLIASLVQNTSLNVHDIEELRINEMEDLLQGISENNEELNKKYGNGGKEQLEGDDAIHALLGK